MTNLDPTPAFAFGHGLSYTTFSYDDLRLTASEVPFAVSCTVGNTGDVVATEVAQLYLEDPVASVTRPVLQLIGFARVPLEPGEQKRVMFRVHTDRTAFTGVDLRRIVEPGQLGLLVGGSSADLPLTGTVTLVGETREAGHGRVLTTPVDVQPAG